MDSLNSTRLVDCDLVLEMEDAGIGVAEIVQYAQGVLTDEEIRELIAGLRRLVPGDDAGEAEIDDTDDEDLRTDVEVPAEGTFAMV